MTSKINNNKSKTYQKKRGELEFFASCPRGLENLLGEEILQIAKKFSQNLVENQIIIIAGGVTFFGDLNLMMQVNLYSRFATRILLKLDEQNYRNEQDIYQFAKSQQWSLYFDVANTFKVSTTAIRCPLKSLNFLTLTVKDAICDFFREEYSQRPNVATFRPDVLVHLFIKENSCSLYLDTSGEPLWLRGYRKKSVAAPLKENLAAAMIDFTNWNYAENQPFVDAMCGSGTLILEALQKYFQLPANINRLEFGFEKLKIFDEISWKNIKQQAENNILQRLQEIQQNSPKTPILLAFDNDKNAIYAIKENLKNFVFLNEKYFENFENFENFESSEKFDLKKFVLVQCQDILNLQISEFTGNQSGVLLCNPPYGERLSDLRFLMEFYPQLATALKNNWAGWLCGFLSADLQNFVKGLRLKPSRKIPLFNGDLDCRLFLFPMVAGSNRKIKNE